MHKVVPESDQTCFEHVLGRFVQRTFFPGALWRVKSSKTFKKIRPCKIYTTTHQVFCRKVEGKVIFGKYEKKKSIMIILSSH